MVPYINIQINSVLKCLYKLMMNFLNKFGILNSHIFLSSMYEEIRYGDSY